MIARLLIASMVLLGAASYLAHASQEEQVPSRRPLKTLPLQLERWYGQELPALDGTILNVLGVDEYVNRVYANVAEPPIALYVGFYESQRQGDTIHSPLNCLPGAGWEAVRQDRTAIAVARADRSTERITVNQFVVQKGLDRQLVLYWYQSHGRVIASEYTSRMYMVYDAIRLNRTDGALVRVITPIVDRDSLSEEAANRRALAFVEATFPRLSELLPS